MTMGCLCGSATHGVAGREQFWSVARHSNGSDLVLVIEDERYRSEVRLALDHGDLVRLIACLERCLPKMDGEPGWKGEAIRRIEKLESADLAKRVGDLETDVTDLNAEASHIRKYLNDVDKGGSWPATRRIERIERAVSALQHAVQRQEGPPKAGPGENDPEPPAPKSVPDVRLKSPRQLCRDYSIQACHYCERLACGDNTSPGAALYRAAKAVVESPKGVLPATVGDLARLVDKMTVLTEATKKVEEMA